MRGGRCGRRFGVVMMGPFLPLLSRSAPPVELPLARLDTACDFRVLVVVVQQPLVGGADPLSGGGADRRRRAAAA
ncbi:hypothetical protein QRZ34_28925 [Klebsiella michiganensis]|uniref:hypothetical protein n=1 Tax=Klebsiella michiganensis TaxID=1134687 RepID=UPI0025704AD3|nr:hypothetical protein [Klebsiella michiganensis]MDL4455011.1 hypothetical protein [Klebsiella michiganensis]